MTTDFLILRGKLANALLHSSIASLHAWFKHLSHRLLYLHMFVYVHTGRGSRSLQNLTAIPRDSTDQCPSQKWVVKETTAKLATQSRD